MEKRQYIEGNAEDQDETYRDCSRLSIRGYRHDSGTAEESKLRDRTQTEIEIILHRELKVHCRMAVTYTSFEGGHAGAQVDSMIFL